MTPFLDIIQSNEVDGPITGEALLSVVKLLDFNFLDVAPEKAALAIQNVARAATNCLFDSSDRETDEVILSRIIRLIHKCIDLPQSALLSKELIVKLVSSCYKMSIQPHSSPHLRKTAEATLIYIVQKVFVSYNLPWKKSMEDALNANVEAPFAVETEQEEETTLTADSHTNRRGIQFDREEIQIDRTSVSGISAPYGISTLESLLNSFCSNINPRNNTIKPNEHLLSLNVINAIIEVAVLTFMNESRLLKIVRTDLTRYLLDGLKTSDRRLLSTSLRICFNLFTVMRSKLEFQLEIFLNLIYSQFSRRDIKSTESTPVSFDVYANQEAALEIIVQLCNDPNFVVDLYVGYDCDLRSSNLFEKLIGFLNRFCHPTHDHKGVISEQSLHFLAMDGLSYILNALETRLNRRIKNDYSDEDRSILENEKSLLNEMKRKKKVKNVLISGAERFNQHYKEGFSYLQKHGVLPDPLDPVSVAEFFKNTSFLDKTMVGDYLGRLDDFNVEVLKEYCKLFDYRNKPFVDTIRIFIESFRLPGESQIIERILDHFSIELFDKNPGLFANIDCCYLVCMSVIVLNVELHNPNVNDNRRMKLNQYINSLKGQNGEKDLPEEFLVEIYNSIKENEIKVLQDNEGQTDITNAMWKGKIDKFSQKKKDPNDAMIQTAAYLGVYDELLFMESWKDIHVGLKAIFMDSAETEVLGDLMLAITIYGKLAATYNNPQSFDTMVNTLCERSTILHSNTIEPFEVRFARDKKAQIAAKLMFNLAKQHTNVLRESWKNIFNCLLRLKKLDLLPPSKDIDELFEKVESSQELNSDKKSSPFLSLVNNILSWTTSDTQDQEKQSAMKEICKNIFLECDIEEIVKNDNLRQYIQSIIKQ